MNDKSMRSSLTGRGTYSSSSLARFRGSTELTEIFRDSFCISIVDFISTDPDAISDFNWGAFVSDLSKIPSSSNSSGHVQTSVSIDYKDQKNSYQSQWYHKFQSIKVWRLFLKHILITSPAKSVNKSTKVSNKSLVTATTRYPCSMHTDYSHFSTNPHRWTYPT